MLFAIFMDIYCDQSPLQWLHYIAVVINMIMIIIIIIIITISSFSLLSKDFCAKLKDCTLMREISHIMKFKLSKCLEWPRFLKKIMGTSSDISYVIVDSITLAGRSDVLQAITQAKKNLLPGALCECLVYFVFSWFTRPFVLSWFTHRFSNQNLTFLS